MILFQRHPLDDLETEDLSNVCLDMNQFKKQLRLFYWAVSISAVQTITFIGLWYFLGSVSLMSVYVSAATFSALLLSYLVYRKYKLLRNIVERVAVRFLN